MCILIDKGRAHHGETLATCLLEDLVDALSSSICGSSSASLEAFSANAFALVFLVPMSQPAILGPNLLFAFFRTGAAGFLSALLLLMSCNREGFKVLLAAGATSLSALCRCPDSLQTSGHIQQCAEGTRTEAILVHKWVPVRCPLRSWQSALSRQCKSMFLCVWIGLS